MTDWGVKQRNPLWMNQAAAYLAEARRCVAEAEPAFAQVIEARRAETENTGSVHESAVAASDAPEHRGQGSVDRLNDERISE